MATNGDDVLTFSGTLGQLTLSIVNPFSNEILNIDDEFNINDSIYDGLAGIDRLNMTSIGDALFLVDPNTNQQMVQNVEVFIAGRGGDIVNLAHETITLGDLFIAGGDGDDILWGNVGNDFISGAKGSDIIDGGPGHDQLLGNQGNDRINGGTGNDDIEGGDGNDILFGGFDAAPIVHDKDFFDTVSFPHLLEGVNIANLVPPGTNALGFANGNMSVDFDAQATLTFREGFAGYNNSLGVYSVAADGSIEMGTMLWANTKTAGLGVAHEIDLPVGADGGDFGFFIIANGDRENSGYGGLDITGEGNIKFMYDFGGAGERAAKIDDDGSLVTVVYDDGVTVQALDGYHYHTTERGESTAINSDGAAHIVSGLVDVGQQDVLRVGFEDLRNLGDADFEDVFFDFNIVEEITPGAPDSGYDILDGGLGDDILYGQDGNDTLIMGLGLDNAYGGSGADQFIYDLNGSLVIDGLVDTIHDFEMGAGNDLLDISDILHGYDPLTDAISDFVEVTSLNGDTHVNVNLDGTGSDFDQLVTLTGVDTTLTDLINNGNLVA